MACNSWCASALLAALLLVAPFSHAENIAAYRGSLTASIDEAPADISAVTLSAVALLRGLRDPSLLGPVKFKSGVADKLHDPHTRLEGFDLTGFRLTYLGPSSSGQAGRRIIGILTFDDAAGRRAEISYAIDYTLDAETLLVREAMIGRKSPARPRVLMYAVPASRVPADFLMNLRPFGETLAWLANNASAVGASAPVPPEVHYVFALSLDRLGEEDRLILDKGQNASQSLLDIGGWQMVVRRIVPREKPQEIRTSVRSAKTGRTVTDVATLTLIGAPARRPKALQD